MYKQLVQPNLDTKANAGMCLAFVQSVYGAPVRYRSAWEAWNATQLKRDGAIPDASVPVWFSHFGTYGNPPSYENWGHVVAHIPGYGYLSSPGQGYGSEVLPSIEAVEKRFNSKFVGWSLDINGLEVVEETENPPTPTVQRKQREMMFVIIKETGVGVVIGEYSLNEIDPKTDPVEFASAEAIWGAGMNRVYITLEQLRIEKIQLEKRRSEAPK